VFLPQVEKLQQTYVPRIFGYRLHSTAYQESLDARKRSLHGKLLIDNADIITTQGMGWFVTEHDRLRNVAFITHVSWQGKVGQEEDAYAARHRRRTDGGLSRHQERHCWSE
jgi:hypothetical protein